jgi:hypothetical protein
MLQKKRRSATAKGWRKFVHDEFILAFGALVLIAWLAAAFTTVTGLTFHGRRLTKLRRATAAEIQRVWHVPALVTVLCTPILIWRVWKVRQ